MHADAERRVNEDGKSVMAYVVVLSPPFDQLLRYHISEAEQEATRCALCQHWPSDECGTVKTRRVVLPSFPASSVATHLYARSREAIIAEVAASVQSVAQSRSATFAGDHHT